ncbi:MAG: elongation factor P maturation arginine rhamnosyltransferase EarP [Chitinispirillia bacterium]|nr:elongation factor P maturation arginine rhamnosyltransferase EarP [Chitinispirillia bacterium]
MIFSSIDIFCNCIDNFGDAGVVYRFAKEFNVKHPQCRIRVFIDSKETLQTIVKEIDPNQLIQEHESITYISTLALREELNNDLGVADIMVEAFACHIPEPLLELAYDKSKLIINLEYLSAENWVDDYHLKESLLGRGSVRKFFFMPGFRKTTGGLILNSRLKSMLADNNFDRFKVLNALLSPFCNFHNVVDLQEDELIGTVFTYKRGFDSLLVDLAALNHETTLLIFGEKSKESISASLNRLLGDQYCESGKKQYPQEYRYKNIKLIYMPFIDQHSYDTLLCCTDFNIVRGEDSLARAVLSGKPFIWNAYIQDEKYQQVKVKALLETMRPFYKDITDFTDYSDLMIKFNDAASESTDQTTTERYHLFLKNLKKHEHAAGEMSYFIHLNCDLINNFTNFLNKFQN